MGSSFKVRASKINCALLYKSYCYSNLVKADHGNLVSCVVEAAALTPPSKGPILSKMAAVKRSLLVLTCLLALRASSAITYVPKCYCPGKDPYLARDANLKNKMYHLKSEYTTNQLKINYRPGWYLHGIYVP